MATWIVAAWLIDHFDRFPHLAITSPEKRCGKTRTLQIIETVAPNPVNTSNISPAATYRLIEQRKPTLLFDESQSIVRRASESSEVQRELLNSSIDRDAVIIRCGGANHTELHEFKTYCPKVIALIGELDSVLADRCLPIELKRKTIADNVSPYRSRIVKPIGEAISKATQQWAEEHTGEVADIYDQLEPFNIQNDRMAELLLPLQAILTVGEPDLLPELEAYANDLEKAEAASQNNSPGVLLLRACNEILGKQKFVATSTLLTSLAARKEEPWHRWSKGEQINAEALARLLRPYGIRSHKHQVKVQGKVITTRGYLRIAFEEAWERYVPPTT